MSLLFTDGLFEIVSQFIYRAYFSAMLLNKVCNCRQVGIWGLSGAMVMP